MEPAVQIKDNLTVTQEDTRKIIKEEVEYSVSKKFTTVILSIIMSALVLIITAALFMNNMKNTVNTVAKNSEKNSEDIGKLTKAINDYIVNQQLIDAAQNTKVSNQLSEINSNVKVMAIEIEKEHPSFKAEHILRGSRIGVSN